MSYFSVSAAGLLVVDWYRVRFRKTSWFYQSFCLIKKRERSLVRGGVCSVLALATLLGFLGCQEKPPVDWKTYNYDKFHLSVDSPYPLVEVNVPWGESVEKNSVQRVAVQTPDNTQAFFGVTLSSIEYVGNIGISLNDLADTSMKGMGKVYTNMKYDSKMVTCSGIPAILSTGTGKLIGFSERRILILNTYKGQWLYQISIQYLDTDLEEEAMAQRMVQSMKIVLPN